MYCQSVSKRLKHGVCFASAAKMCIHHVLLVHCHRNTKNVFSRYTWCHMTSPAVWGPSADSCRLEVLLHWRFWLCRRSWSSPDWREAYTKSVSRAQFFLVRRRWRGNSRQCATYSCCSMTMVPLCVCVGRRDRNQHRLGLQPRLVCWSLSSTLHVQSTRWQKRQNR